MTPTDPTDIDASPRSRTAAALLLVGLVVVAAGPGVAAAHGGHSPGLAVALAEDGDADVTLTLTYALESDDERTAFRTLQNDSDARADARDRFRSRMGAVASDASNATGREMTVRDATMDLSTTDDGSVGVVELSVTWTNLAATEDGALVVTEPFASGFEPDRPFTLRGPDGYELADASPSPDSTGDGAATWDAGTDLSGFQATFEASADGGSTDGAATDGGSDGVGAPGFGAAVALAALAAAALALARRR